MNVDDLAARKPVANPHHEIVCKRINDLCVLLDLRSGEVYTLNETASRLWELIEEQTSIDDISFRMVQEYGVSRDEIVRDITDFIASLAQEGLLIWPHSQGDPGSPE